LDETARKAASRLDCMLAIKPLQKPFRTEASWLMALRRSWRNSSAERHCDKNSTG
jgi:hypothetical protein